VSDLERELTEAHAATKTAVDAASSELQAKISQLQTELSTAVAKSEEITAAAASAAARDVKIAEEKVAEAEASAEKAKNQVLNDSEIEKESVNIGVFFINIDVEV
jgi:seryl-tRNA synthetase